MAVKGEPRIDWVLIDELERWPRNPKRHDVETLKRSIQRFGFVAPILFDEGTGRIVAGHGRLDALLQLREEGSPVPRGIREEDGAWLAPVIRGLAFDDEKEAEAYLLADNRLVELGGWSDRKLLEILSDLQDAPLGLDGTGFDEQVITMLSTYISSAVDSLEAFDSPGDVEVINESDYPGHTYKLVFSCSSQKEENFIRRRLGLEGKDKQKFDFSEVNVDGAE